jgi:hypothetical protein
LNYEFSFSFFGIGMDGHGRLGYGDDYYDVMNQRINHIDVRLRGAWKKKAS